MTIAARKPYTKRKSPEQYNPGFEDVEHANIMRAIPRTTSVAVTTDYSIVVTDTVIVADATAAPFSVTLPSADAVHDFPATIIKIDASANAVTIIGTVSGVVNPTLTAQWQSMSLQSIGSTYVTIGAVP